MSITIKLSDIAPLIYEHASIRTAYSGRAMYGRACFALVLDNVAQLVSFTKTVGYEVSTDDEHPLHTFYSIMHHVCVDNMGLSMIYYWPGVQIESD